MPHRSQDLPRPGSGRQRREQVVHGTEPDHEVVAVITIAEDRIQPRQIGRVSGDDAAAPGNRDSQ